jgi:hypothetical protein
LADLVSDETPPFILTIGDGLALKSTTMVVGGGTAGFLPGTTYGSGAGSHGGHGGPGLYSDHVAGMSGWATAGAMGKPGPAGPVGTSGETFSIPFKASTGQYGVLETRISGDGIPYVGGGNTQSSAPPPVSKDKPSESKEAGSW